MKICYIGCLNDGTGYSYAALNYIRALVVGGHDVLPRSVKLNQNFIPFPEDIRVLHDRPNMECDVIIHHILPNYFEYSAKHKNIGLFAIETSNFRQTGWAPYCNLMDQILIPSRYGVESCKESGVTTKTDFIPKGYDLSKYTKSYETINLGQNEDTFIFYTIGEFIKRKNLSDLIKAFHITFRPYENVSLVIKTYIPGVSSEEANKNIEEYCNTVKSGLKLYPNLQDYKNEIIITGFMSDEQIMSLHQTCHCFVSTSYGECGKIPSYEAMAMGRGTILPDSTSFKDYFTNETSWLIPTNEEPCFAAIDSIPNLYTGNQSWFAPNLSDLCKAMREAYDNKDILYSKIDNGINHSYNFTLDHTAQVFNEILSKI